MGMIIAGNSHVAIFRNRILNSKRNQVVSVKWTGAITHASFVHNNSSARTIRTLFSQAENWKILSIGMHDVFMLCKAKLEGRYENALRDMLACWHSIFTDLNSNGKFAWLISPQQLRSENTFGLSEQDIFSISDEFNTKLTDWCVKQGIVVVNPLPHILSENNTPKEQFLQADGIHLNDSAIEYYIREINSATGERLTFVPSQAHENEVYPNTEPESLALLVAGELGLEWDRTQLVHGSRKDFEKRLCGFVSGVLSKKGIDTELERDSDYNQENRLTSMDFIDIYTFANELAGEEMAFDVHIRDLNSIEKIANFVYKNKELTKNDFLETLTPDLPDSIRRSETLLADFRIAGIDDDTYSHFKEIIQLQTNGRNFVYGIILFWLALIEAQKQNYGFALHLLKNAQELNLLFPFLSYRNEFYTHLWQNKLIEKQKEISSLCEEIFKEKFSDDTNQIKPFWPSGHHVCEEDELLFELGLRSKEIVDQIEIIYAIGAFGTKKCEAYLNTFKHLKAIYFFVPISELADHLQKVNRMDSRIHLLPYALTDRNGYDLLAACNTEEGLKFHMGQQNANFTGKTTLVQCRTIEEAIEESKLPLPDMIIYNIIGMADCFFRSIPSRIASGVKIYYFAADRDLVFSQRSNSGGTTEVAGVSFSSCGFSPFSNKRRSAGHFLYLNNAVAPILAKKQLEQARFLENEIPLSILVKKPCETTEGIDKQIEEITQEAYQHGIELLKKGDISEALNALNSTVRICPTHVMALYQLGMIYWANKDIDKTNGYLSSAFSIDPSNIKTAASFAKFLIAVSKSKKAEKVIRLCLQLNPGDKMLTSIDLDIQKQLKNEASVKDRYKRIEALAEQGSIENAMSELEKFIQEFPDFALGHNDLAVMSYQEGYKEKALKHYQEAVRLEPANATFQKNLADYYYVELGQVETALKIYLRLLDNNPNDIETLTILGNICESLNKAEDAKVFYSRVLEIEPGNVDARGGLNELGGGTEDGGRTTESRGQRTVVGGQRPKLQEERGIEPPEKLYQTAQGFMEGGKEEEAVGALRVFLGLYPDYALAHNDLGALYYNEGQKEKALKHYEQAAQLEPNSLTFQKNLADFYYFELERIEEALKIYNAILDENPEDLEVLLVMGHICVKLDKIDDAIDFYNRILEIDSGNEGAIEMLRQIRKTAAQFFLDKTHEDLSEHYIPEYGSTHRKILASSLKDYPLSDDEQAFLDTLTAKLNSVEKSPEAIPPLLASMLYYYPHQLPIEFDILQVPDWLQEDYCAFLLSYPRCFTKQGEVDDYCRYIKKIFASFCKSIQDAPHSKTLQELAAIITQKAYFIPLYFSNENLTDIYHHRAAIAELSLKAQGYDLNFSFPNRNNKRKRLRLGIYSKVIAPGTEAFATLPVYEYLNREEFEVFLYVHQQNGNPVETHARQLSDRFIELPENMKTSVEIIRADDLDVLFFSNNLTSVMNYPFILANHRLARFQCVHFCQPVSSGLKHIDYFFLGGVIQEKGKEEERYHEQIVNLEGSGICFDLRSSDAQPAAAMSREQIGIPENSIVFVSGANFFKIIPELRHLWAKLLAKVPESVLVLYPFGPEWPTSYPKSVFRDHFKKTLSKYDVKEDSLIILDPLPTREDIKALLRITDVYLDAVPYSGATSLLDPLKSVFRL